MIPIGGLFMLVTKTGSKLWRNAYNFDSKQKLLALGQYPVTSLADARIKRDDAKKLLAEGIDPSVRRPSYGPSALRTATAPEAKFHAPALYCQAEPTRRRIPV